MNIKIYNSFAFLFIAVLFSGYAQEEASSSTYKKRVLETSEIDFLSSYYTQDGNNAAVTGGLGTEELSDITGTVVITIPLNADDVLTIDSGISAYTSASSSNVDPFDGNKNADAFVASSGASRQDVWSNFTLGYSHSSDDRNNIVSAKLSVSAEFDYFSFGFGGAYTKLFNEKNTEISINTNVYLDSWTAIYPVELRPFTPGGNGIENGIFTNNTITGNTNYSPIFIPFEEEKRNSYSLGINFSQILSKKLQASLTLDFVKQEGLLSTPFQRVYFNDFEDSFIDNFHLADAIEQLPNSRFKTAAGARLHYYINEVFVLRSYYRYYLDDWGIDSHTINLEAPIKITDKFTLYPSYRFYTQNQADYFSAYNQNLSTDAYYTSDYDLSKYKANQYGFGITYTDIFTNFQLWRFGLKSIHFKYNNYTRNSGLKANIISTSFNFEVD